MEKTAIPASDPKTMPEIVSGLLQSEAARSAFVAQIQHYPDSETGIDDVAARLAASFQSALRSEGSRLSEVIAQARQGRRSEVRVPPRPFREGPRVLPPLKAEGVPGISAVTACRNPGPALAEAVTSWAALHEITEILIVDWSSDQPVASLLPASVAGDNRIRIVRVENETVWRPAHAFNVGLRAAHGDTLLKVDPDTILAADFFRRNPVLRDRCIVEPPTGAVAGSGREAGILLAPRAALARVGGFNEYLSDAVAAGGDLLRRLALSPLQAVSAAAATVVFRDAPAVTAGTSGASGLSAREELLQDGAFPTCRDRFIAGVLPVWDDRASIAAYARSVAAPNLLVLRRQSVDLPVVPGHVRDFAERQALVELASRTFGPGVWSLEPEAVTNLLERPLSAVSRVDPPLTAGRAVEAITPGQSSLVIRAEPAVLRNDDDATQHVLRTLVARAQFHGLSPMVQSKCDSLPPQSADALAGLPFLGSSTDIGPAENIIPRLLLDDQPLPTGRTLRINVTEETVQRLSAALERLARQPKPAPEEA